MMFEVKSIIRPERVAAVVRALHDIPEMPGITVSVVRGIGKRTPVLAGDSPQFGETPMAKLEIVVPERLVRSVMEAVYATASTGRAGDGKVFVSQVDDAMTLRSGARGPSAL